MSQRNPFVLPPRTIAEENASRERWEQQCNYLVDREKPRFPLMAALYGFVPGGWRKSMRSRGAKPYRRGPIVRIALRPGDVDMLLWLALAFALAIFAATWLPGVM